MTKVGGKRRKLLLDVDPVAIPAEKCADGEAMPEIVQPWPAMVAWAPQADLTGLACAFRGIVSSSAAPRARFGRHLKRLRTASSLNEEAQCLPRDW